MRPPVPSLITLLAVALVAAPALAEKREVALVSYGAAADELEPELRAALGKLSTIALRDQKATRDDVAAAGELGTTCEAASPECLVSLAVLLRVDVLVVATAERGAEGTALELFAIDAASGREVAREHALAPRDARAVSSDAARPVGAPATLASGRGGASLARAPSRADQVRDVVQLLLEPQLHFGSLVVTSDVPATSLTVDGVLRPESPHPRAQVRVRAGGHDVEVNRAGYAPFTAAVQVAAGTEAVVTASLTPLPVAGKKTTAAAAPVPDTAAPLLSAAVVASVTGLGVAVVAGAIAVALDVGLGAGLGSFAEKQGYQTAGLVALGVAGAGAAVAIGGGVMALVAGNDEPTAVPP